MTLLTTSNERAAFHWEKIINVARDELAMGSFLLEEAKSLSSEKVVLSALGTLVAGLGEYVRVVRSIAATLCDLLGVDVNMDANKLKDRLSLLDSALEAEELWTNVEGAAKGLNLPLPQLESIANIRTKCLQRFPGNNLCQLTLQPLSTEYNGTTLSRVEWDGRFFMVCAANLWSNRVLASAPM